MKRKAEESHLRRGLKRVAEWCKSNRHLTLREQFEHLQKKLRGHYAYYGITWNHEESSVFSTSRSTHMGKVAESAISEILHARG